MRNPILLLTVLFGFVSGTIAPASVAQDAGSAVKAAGEDRASLLASVHRQARRLGVSADVARQQGIRLPVDLLPTVSRALSLGPGDSREQLTAIHDRLLGYVDELSLLEDNPEILGQVVLDRPGELVAGQRVNLTQTFEVNTTLARGAALAVGKHWAYPYSLQTSNPDANNYIAVSTDGRAELGLQTVMRDGTHGGLYRDVHLPLVQIEEGQLRPGDTITIDYAAGSRGFLLPDQAMEHFVLPLYLRERADDYFIMLPVESMEIVGGSANHVTAVMPSHVKVGQPVQLKVRLEDTFGNLASGDFPSLEILVNGLFQDRIPAGRDPLPVLDSLTFETTGIHRVAIQSSGGGIVGESNPVWVSREDPQYRINWMDLHRHSQLSDGVNSPSAIREQGLTDIQLVVDHDNYLTRSKWQSIARRHGVKGFEWSLPIDKGGHHLVLSRNPFEFGGALRELFPDLGNLIRGLNPDDTTIIALPEIPADTRFHDPSMTRLVEIKSGEGTYEWLGNRFAKAGLRIGFTGSANSHISRFGRMSSRGVTALYLSEGENWWDALRQRHTYVTSGARMILHARMNGALPGSRIENTNKRIIRGEVVGTAGISSVELVRNGAEIDRREYATVSSGTTLRVTMKSDSRPWRGERDLPRNGREWIGFLKISGNRIESISAPGFTNASRHDIAVNPEEDGRVDFITWTRGQPRSFMVNLASDELENGMLELSLKEGFEDVDQIPANRAPQPIPSIRIQVALEDLQFGRITRKFNVTGYQDSVSFELVEPDLSVRQVFEFVDTRDFTADYYYLRIRQMDDQYLWSTPFWVGGFDIH